MSNTELVPLNDVDAVSLTELADAINQQHRKCEAAVMSGVEHAFSAGQMLQQAKRKVQHGEWIRWLEENFHGSYRTAAMYMQVVSQLTASGTDLQDLADLPLEQVVRLLQAPRHNVLPAPVDDDQPLATGTVSDLSDLVRDGLTYGCIYADPPWKYGNQGTRASTDNHYGTMTIEELCAEPVAKLAAENCHLHLWTTNAFVKAALTDVMPAWGFEYKSCFVWVKPQMGMGNYWRVSHEFLLFGIKGKADFRDRSQMSWLQHDRTQHSAKPEEVRRIIEKVSPGPYLEMYGRHIIDDWTVYGNQIERDLFHE